MDLTNSGNLQVIHAARSYLRGAVQVTDACSSWAVGEALHFNVSLGQSVFLVGHPFSL